MAKLVGDVAWTIGLWKRCGIKSNPGSDGLRGGRMRTADYACQYKLLLFFPTTPAFSMCRQ